MEMSRECSCEPSLGEQAWPALRDVCGQKDPSRGRMGSGLVESPRMILGLVSSGNQEDELITKRDSRLEENSSLQGETE